MTDLIEEYQGILDAGACKALIDIFENSSHAKESKIISAQGDPGLSSHIRRSSGLILSPDNCGPHYMTLNNAFKQSYAQYVKTFPVLERVTQILTEAFTLLRYSDSNDHYGWHVDGADPGSRYRYLTGIMYLNTVPQGGETEFRVQQKKIKPTEGTVVLFPSGWPYEHRGLPPIEGKKYIITTWLRFADYPAL